jgi:hypothetical protein
MTAMLAVLIPSGIRAAEASATPEAAMSPSPTMTPPEALCGSVSDLQLIVEFLRGTDVEEEGWVPVLVGVVAALSEARALASAAGQTYAPLVDELVTSLEQLRTTIDEARGTGTIGSRIAAIGEAVTGIGNAMDALAVQTRTPCPTAAGESPAPV